MKSHILKEFELSILCRKKVMFQKSHPVKKETYIFVLFLFMMQNNSYSCLVLKFQVSKLKTAIEVIKLSIWPQKCSFSKRL